MGGIILSRVSEEGLTKIVIVEEMPEARMWLFG